MHKTIKEVFLNKNVIAGDELENTYDFEYTTLDMA